MEFERQKHLNKETTMNQNLSIPTLYYPFFNRANLKYWYRLNNGHYQVKNFVNLSECIKMAGFCKLHGIPFKAGRQSIENSLAWNLLLINTLLVLNRVNSNKTSNTSIEKLKVNISSIEAI